MTPTAPDTPDTDPDVTLLNVRVLVNDSMDGFVRGFRPGDTFAEALRYREAVATGRRTGNDSGDDEGAEDPVTTLMRLAEKAFELTNLPDEVLTADQLALLGDYHRRFNSLSVGDVVVIGETALACGRLSWDPVTLPDGAVGDDRIDAHGRHCKKSPARTDAQSLSDMFREDPR